jgi:hypothetical protein
VFLKRVPADLPVLRDRKTLAQVLASFGTKFVREVSDPTVIAVFRLAIAEAVQAPKWRVRSTLSDARQAAPPCVKSLPRPRRPDCSRVVLPNLPSSSGLLWRDLMVSLLLGVAERPNSSEIAGRGRDATAAFLQLRPLPNDAPAC